LVLILEDDCAVSKQYLAAQGVEIPTIDDGDMRLCAEVIHRLPTTVLLSGDREVVSVHEGAISLSQLRGMLGYTQ
jgi:hypothetical protein